MSALGTVSGLWRYPVKSMSGELLSAASFGEHGLAGDRAYALRDEDSGLITDGKKIPKLMACRARYLEEPGGSSAAPIEIVLPTGQVLRGCDSDMSRGLSAFCGRELCLVRRELPATFFDVHSVHLITSASVACVQEAAPDSKVSAIRFRPNVLIDTGATRGWLENRWSGMFASIGMLKLQVEERTERCSMVMRAQEGVPEDAALLRAVVATGNHVGVYCTVQTPGEIRMGDELQVELATLADD